MTSVQAAAVTIAQARYLQIGKDDERHYPLRAELNKAYGVLRASGLPRGMSQQETLNWCDELLADARREENIALARKDGATC